MAVVYIVENHITGKIYIGATDHYNRRMSQHQHARTTSELHQAIRYHGWKNFSHSILFTGSADECFQKEVEFIKKYNSTDPAIGYNVLSGGIVGFQTTKLARQKISRGKEKMYLIIDPHGNEHEVRGVKRFLNEHYDEIRVSYEAFHRTLQHGSKTKTGWCLRKHPDENYPKTFERPESATKKAVQKISKRWKVYHPKHFPGWTEVKNLKKFCREWGVKNYSDLSSKGKTFNWQARRLD
jgi:group I intron endonuclease